MRQAHLIVVLAGVIVVGALTTQASATYDPGLGCFLQRDPGPGASPTHVVLVGSPVELEGFMPRDSIEQADPDNEMTHLYQYGAGNPINQVDPLGTSPMTMPDIVRNLQCCTCLLYSESGGSPGCMAAVVSVMQNRQKTNWPDFKSEDSFCAQAQMPGRWPGGQGNPRYDQCDKCPFNGSGLPPGEKEAAAAANQACYSRQFGGGNDPTGGAQYYWSKGKTPDWMKKQKGNCSRVSVPNCPLEFWKCKKRPLAQ